jgi:transposase
MDTSEVTVATRRYRTNAEKVRIVEETMAEGVSVASVARRHGLNANLLFNWRRRYQQGLLERSREPVAAKLLPVHVEPEPEAMPSASRGTSAGQIQVSLPGGIVIDVRGEVDAALLGTVLRVLRSR